MGSDWRIMIKDAGDLNHKLYELSIDPYLLHKSKEEIVKALIHHAERKEYFRKENELLRRRVEYWKEELRRESPPDAIEEYFLKNEPK